MGALNYSSGWWAIGAKDELNNILNVCIEKYVFSILSLFDERSFCFMALMIKDGNNYKQIPYLKKIEQIFFSSEHVSENYFRFQ